MIASFFDADGTLYSNQFGRGLMQYARTHGRRFAAFAYFTSLILPVLLMRLRWIDSEPVDRAKISRLAWLLRGWDRERASSAFAWVTDEWLLATRREHVLSRLRSHQDSGHYVLIASGTFTSSLEVLGKRLGVDHLVGTGLEFKNGAYTGAIRPPIIKGADKTAAVVEYIQANNVQIDAANSYAYGDSFSDAGMLKLVGHPVAVHPDERLRDLASRLHWEILEAP
jgi:HAD superfamily hydrolase (TIGR01490 family)